MTDARKLPYGIQWHEGMLLAPQHFQQFSARLDALLHYHVLAASPFHWGIRRFRLDPVLLIEGSFRVMELEAVMPDGLVIQYRAETSQPLEVDLTEHAETMAATPLTIHLAVPAIKSGQSITKGVLARYESVEGAPVVDENTGDTEMVMPRLKPRITLLTGDTPAQKYCSFPLAKVSYKNETYALTEFVPPSLAVPVRSELGFLCAGIARRLREKAVFLSDQINSPAAALRGPMTLETKLLVHAMVSGLPFFEGLIQTGRAHPYAVYLSLCQIVGNLAALGAGLVPPVLSPYDHNDPATAFAEVQNFAFRMIDEGVVESHSAIAFDFENGVFGLELRREWLTPTLVIGVRGRSDMPEEMVTAWMRESLIGSATEIPSMQERRIRGAVREKIEEDADLVPARGLLLYAVKADPEFIVAEKPLQVLNTSDPQNKRGPAEVILYVKNKP